jgi:hypothetical protein
MIRQKNFYIAKGSLIREIIMERLEKLKSIRREINTGRYGHESAAKTCDTQWAHIGGSTISALIKLTKRVIEWSNPIKNQSRTKEAPSTSDLKVTL